MSSHTSLIDHCNSVQLLLCQSSVFEDLQIFITQGSELHSFLWMWTLRPHFWAKMFDVGDLPVLTFGNCALKTGVIGCLWNCTDVFNVFFSKSKKMTFYVFLSCCTRFRENCCLRPLTSCTTPACVQRLIYTYPTLTPSAECRRNSPVWLVVVAAFLGGQKD